MKLNKCVQQLSLVTLLAVLGSANPIQAKNADSASDNSITADCIEAFGNYEMGEMDEFEGIELTAEQSIAVEQAAQQLDTQLEQLLSPEQLSALEAQEAYFEAEFMAILTPEQQQLAQAGNLDIESLSPEQKIALERIESQLLETNMEVQDFSAEQIERLEDYENEYEEAVLTVLNPSQKEQYSQNQFQLHYPDLALLNLSAAQRQQITQLDNNFTQSFTAAEVSQSEEDLNQLVEQYETQLMNILTDAQKQQLRDIWAQQEHLEDQCWDTTEEPA